MFPVKNEVLDALSDRTAETEIMVSGKQTLEEVLKTDVFNQACTGLRSLREEAIGVVLCGTQGIEALQEPRRGVRCLGKVIWPRCSNFERRVRQAISLS